MSEIKDLEKAFFILEHGSSEGLPKYLKAIEMIKEQCVQVVRCKDCENWDEEYSSGKKSLGNYRCICHEWSDEEDGHYRYTAEDEYCSRAERKDGADDEG